MLKTKSIIYFSIEDSREKGGQDVIEVFDTFYEALLSARQIPFLCAADEVFVRCMIMNPFHKTPFTQFRIRIFNFGKSYSVVETVNSLVDEVLILNDCGGNLEALCKTLF